MSTTYDWLIFLLNWSGNISTLIVLGAVVYRTVLWIRGISPALRSMGHGLSRRKIALFATGANLSSLKDALLRSKLFREKNLIYVESAADIANADDATVFVVYWPDWASNIDAVLQRKLDATPLIVYCPRSAGQIPPEKMEAIDGHRNTAVSNFRGRLLNDVVTAMITTSYE